jgi:hypothetical protein
MSFLLEVEGVRSQQVFTVLYSLGLGQLAIFFFAHYSFRLFSKMFPIILMHPTYYSYCSTHYSQK